MTADSLLIVESPAKAKTLKKYLGKSFEVLASYGHVRDLVSKKGAVDPDKGFIMHYEEIDKNKIHVATIAKTLKKAKALYLGTDPDREGEAIAWDLCELLKDKHVLSDKPVYRVSFNQITPRAVQTAIENPREISNDLVNAQKTRRALDHLVGFTLSPLLWEKVMQGLSAGRVQSPALRMLVEREEAIEAFTPEEYWTITANTEHDQQPFKARLIIYNDEKLTQFSITDEKTAKTIEADLYQAANNHLIVHQVEKKQRKRKPPRPFTTSSLQQEAAQHLRFSASKTMRVAQQLYEGIEIGQENAGLITYMRTDSVNIAQEAITETRETIESIYGKALLPNTPPVYKTKTKNAQEAHEAIRPTSAKQTPQSLKSYLNQDQYRLYELIWQRTIASQMIHATIDTVAVDLRAGDKHYFRANGSSISSLGFLTVYSQYKNSEDADMALPVLTVGDKLPLHHLVTEQHFTTPPPRYSEATLIKALEEYGIGRPSTYATIISTLQSRKYAELQDRRFFVSDVGRVVNRFLTNYFTQYVDYNFTAKLEDTLDAVSRGETEWIGVMGKFWTPFKSLVDTIQKTVDRSDVTQEKLNENCPECDHPLSIRLGRRGRFIGCTHFPDCRYTRDLTDKEDQEKATDENQTAATVVEGRQCPKCNHPLNIKQGRYGKFIGCSQYPTCKHVEPLEKPEDTGINCPLCQTAHLFKKRSRRNTYFYGCGNYPKCNYAVWGPPLTTPCPSCQWPITIIKTTKRWGTQRVCPQKDCQFKASHETDNGTVEN